VRSIADEVASLI